MKFVTYNYKNSEAVGILTEDEKAVVPAKSLGFRAESMNEFIDELGGRLPELPAEHIRKLVDLWAERFT